MNWFRGPRLYPALLLGLTCYLIFFYGLGRYPLWDPDEGRVGVIAKEMVASGNWLTLTYNGAPYYDKPVPYFWLVALCLRLLGLNELAVRLPSAVAATLTVASVFLWGAVAGGLRRGLWAGLILATSVEFVFLGRLGKMDMVFAFFFTAALLSFLRWRMGREAALWLFYLFLGLASLAKGPVGIFLPLLIVGADLAVGNRRDLFRKLRLLRGAGVVLGISAPWYLAAALRDPQYIWTFLWDHNVLRFFTLEKGINHPEPLYFFVPVLLVGFLPWSFLLPPILGYCWERREEGAAREEKLFLVVWAAAVFVFFSLARNKLGTYILPMFPPLALLAAAAVGQSVAAERERTRESLWIPWGGLCWLFLLFALPLLAEGVFRDRNPEYFPLNFPWPLAAAFFLAAVLARIFQKEKWIPWVVAGSLLWLVVWFYGEKVQGISDLRSTRALAQVIKENGVKGYRVVAIRAESLPFYLADRVEVVPHAGAVEDLLRESIPTVALVKEKHVKEMSHIPPSKIFVWKTIPSAGALVANFPPAHGAR